MAVNGSWDLNRVPDISNKVVVVTGGNSGLGYESVKALAEKGAELVLASRSQENGQAARTEILKAVKDAKIEVMQLDLGDLDSVKQFAEAFKAKYKRLDILMNNAGIMMTPYQRTKDGFEGQLGVNHLGHFALTALLMDLMEATPGARVVNVSSGAHKMGKMDFGNLMFEDGEGYSPIKAYGRSKLANLLFTYELQRRLESAGKDVQALAAHPGMSATNLARHLEGKLVFRLLNPLFKLMSQDQAAGALPQVRASVDPGARGGEYYGPDGKGERTGKPVLVPSNEASHNREDAVRLWEESEKLTGVSFKLG